MYLKESSSILPAILNFANSESWDEIGKVLIISEHRPEGVKGGINGDGNDNAPTVIPNGFNAKNSEGA